MRRQWGTATTGLVGLLLLATGARVHAAEWSWAPTFSFWVDHDSNRYLAPEGIPSEGTFVSLDLQLRYATERLTLTLHPAVAVQRFSNSAFPDTNDLSLATVDSWAAERATYAFTGIVDEQNLLTTELPTTGIVEPGTRRRDEDTSASWTYAQTERYSFTLLASYYDTVYVSDAATATPLESYHGNSFAATEQQQHSDSLAAFITATAASYTLEEIADPFRTDGIVAGFKLQLSERTSLSADAGVNRTRFSSLTSTGFLGDLTLTRTTETGALTLNASRTVAPVGFGEITQQDVVNVTARRNLEERLSADAGLSYFRYSSVFSIPGLSTVDLTYLDRTYAQVVTGLTWHATETWSLAGHVLATRLSGPTTATGDDWQIRLQATWSPLARSVSR